MRIRGLVTLAPHLSESERETAMRDALAAAVRAVSDNSLPPPNVSTDQLSPKPEELLPGSDWTLRKNAIACLAPHLPAALFKSALAAARDLDEYRRWITVAWFAPYLPEALHPEGLVLANTISEGSTRISAQIALVPFLREPAREDTLRDALSTATRLTIPIFRYTAFLDLSPYLPEAELQTLRQDAIAYAMAVPIDNGGRYSALRNLAPHLPEPERDTVLREALEAVSGMHEVYRSDAKAWITSQLAKSPGSSDAH
jgi:hypothetical protein